MTDWETCPAGARAPGTGGGAGVVRGLRVPGRAVFENRKDGAPRDQVRAGLPGGARGHAAAVLEQAAPARPAARPAGQFFDKTGSAGDCPAAGASAAPAAGDETDNHFQTETRPKAHIWTPDCGRCMMAAC